MSGAILYQTYYSDADCTAAIRTAFDSVSCANLRLDTSCRKEPGWPSVYTRVGCAAESSLAAVGDEAFGAVPQIQLFSTLGGSCPSSLPGYSFQFPLQKCIPNLAGNKVDGKSFTHEMVNVKDAGSAVWALFKDSGCSLTGKVHEVVFNIKDTEKHLCYKVSLFHQIDSSLTSEL
ncbi:hypothetical protein BDR26DRAFT_862808 [Obelidium mucronatum]|nr:hypothetical protein BDR26DRAFT_862808 [Obelidium mucronatum]